MTKRTLQKIIGCLALAAGGVFALAPVSTFTELEFFVGSIVALLICFLLWSLLDRFMKKSPERVEAKNLGGDE